MYCSLELDNLTLSGIIEFKIPSNILLLEFALTLGAQNKITRIRNFFRYLSFNKLILKS